MTPFDNDIFTISRLTAAINEVQYVPQRLGEMGIFQEEGITETTAIVEKSGMQLGLVESKERGAPGDVTGGDKRSGVTFTAVHLPTTSTILADQVQNVRAFGSDDQSEGIETIVNARLEKMVRRLDLTHEYQRIGAVKGQILDADASVLVDLYNAFDITQTTVDMDLDSATTDVQQRCLDFLEAIEAGLDGLMFTGVRVICGAGFWRDLIGHDDVKETHKYQQSQRLRGDGRAELDYGGAIFERYRGGVNGTPFIGDDFAYAIPQGVDNLFITRFAPADYMEAVNTVGLPIYSSSERLRHGKGVELEAQSNPITLCTRPQSVIRLHRNQD